MVEKPIYGWFEAPYEEPLYDPPMDTPCPICGEPGRPEHMLVYTLQAAPFDRPRRLYYYRVHDRCNHTATARERASIFGAMLARILAEQFDA